MLIEMRRYTLDPAFTPQQYLEILSREGLDVQRSTLGGLLGYHSMEVGGLNAVVSLWRYDSFEERQRRRALLAADPRWQACLQRLRPMIRQMENSLMLPAPGIEPRLAEVSLHDPG